MMSSNTINGCVCSNQAKSVIVVIEDNLDHAELITRIITEHPIPNQVLQFHDGRSALDFLFGRSEFGDQDISRRPELILLDLHLPDSDGIEVLRTIKASEELRMIPVVILTTSATDQEIASAYINHVNSYLVKPLGWEQFRELIHVLCSYWLGKNRRPKMEASTREAQQKSAFAYRPRGDYQSRSKSI